MILIEKQFHVRLKKEIIKIEENQFIAISIII